MHIVIWKYVVDFKKRTEFETEYGEDGTWNLFFKASKKYQGSYLSFIEDSTDTYFLIDIWNNKESYECFIKENKNDYNKLSLRCKNLYSREERIGAF